MLYDPKWQSEVKADPFSLESLIAWLETMPPRVRYNWDDCNGGCLIGIYGNAMGIDWNDLHSHFYDANQLHIASRRPHTFGGALERARAVMASR